MALCETTQANAGACGLLLLGDQRCCCYQIQNSIAKFLGAAQIQIVIDCFGSLHFWTPMSKVFVICAVSTNIMVNKHFCLDS